MKELNEIELREVDGGFFNPTISFQLWVCEFCAGFVDGYNESKRKS